MAGSNLLLAVLPTPVLHFSAAITLFSWVKIALIDIFPNTVDRFFYCLKTTFCATSNVTAYERRWYKKLLYVEYKCSYTYKEDLKQKYKTSNCLNTTNLIYTKQAHIQLKSNPKT